jgi:hypothetical protein
MDVAARHYEGHPLEHRHVVSTMKPNSRAFCPWGPTPMSVPKAMVTPALCERARASLIFTPTIIAFSILRCRQQAVALCHLQNRDASNDRRHMESAFGDEQLERASVEKLPCSIESTPASSAAGQLGPEGISSRTIERVSEPVDEHADAR